MTQAENSTLVTLVERIDNLIRRMDDANAAEEKFREDSLKDRAEIHKEILEVRTQFALCQAEKVQRLSSATPWGDRWRGLFFNLMQAAILLGAAAVWAHLYIPRK